MLISTYIYKFLFIYSYICNIYTMPCNFLVILIRVLDCDTPLHILPLIHFSQRWIEYVSSKGENHRKLVTLPIPSKWCTSYMCGWKERFLFRQDLDQMPGPRILLTQVFLFRPKLLLLVNIFNDLYKTRAKADLFKTANSDLHKNIIAVTYLYIAFQNTQSTESVFVPERETIRWERNIFVDRMYFSF